MSYSVFIERVTFPPGAHVLPILEVNTRLVPDQGRGGSTQDLGTHLNDQDLAKLHSQPGPPSSFVVIVGNDMARMSLIRPIKIIKKLDNMKTKIQTAGMAFELC